MSYFKTKMHQIQFRLGSAPDPAGGAYSAPPGAILLRQGTGEEGRGGERRKREGGGRGRGRGGTLGFLLTPPDAKSWIKPWYTEFLLVVRMENCCNHCCRRVYR